MASSPLRENWILIQDGVLHPQQARPRSARGLHFTWTHPQASGACVLPDCHTGTPIGASPPKVEVLSIHGALTAVLELSQMDDPLQPALGADCPGPGPGERLATGLCPAGRVAALHWPGSCSPLPFYTCLVLSPLTAQLRPELRDQALQSLRAAGMILGQAAWVAGLAAAGAGAHLIQAAAQVWESAVLAAAGEGGGLWGILDVQGAAGGGAAGPAGGAAADRATRRGSAGRGAGPRHAGHAGRAGEKAGWGHVVVGGESL